MNQKKVVYPLAQVIEVKQRRVEEAERVLKEKKLALEKEKEKLSACEAARDQVKKHKQDKLNQMRQELDHGTTSPKVQQMKVYLKVVEEKLKIEEKKVKEQQVQVDHATKHVETARQDLKNKRQEVDKLLTHKKDWEKEKEKELDLIEGREQDELGSIIHIAQQRKQHLM